MSETTADLNWWEVPLWKWRNDRSETDKSREPDYQRQRVYNAEDASGMDRVPQRRFSTIEECQAYVTALLADPYIIRRFGTFTVEVIFRSQGHALGSNRRTYGKMWLPRWAFNERVILHELAHCLTPAASGGGHGRRFCRTYLDLVGYKLGRQVESNLRAAFLKLGVKTSPKRPPNVIGEKCAELRSQYYAKPTITRLAPADDTFPETTTEVADWVAGKMGWAVGTVKMRRVLIPGFFMFHAFPGMRYPIEVDVFRLADLNFAEWTSTFREAYEKQTR